MKYVREIINFLEQTYSSKKTSATYEKGVSFSICMSDTCPYLTPFLTRKNLVYPCVLTLLQERKLSYKKEKHPLPHNFQNIPTTMKFTATLLAVAATSVSAFTPAARAPRASFALDANIVDTLASLEGPGQVWGADGIAVGKEESDLKGYDNFGLFVERLQSTGVAATLQGAGPFTVFAPTDTAIQSYEMTKGPVDAAVINYCIVPGTVSSSGLSSAPLETVGGGALVYGRRFRKDFVNDAIVGEVTFGQFSNFPTDVACDNGVVHSIGVVLTPQ